MTLPFPLSGAIAPPFHSLTPGKGVLSVIASERSGVLTVGALISPRLQAVTQPATRYHQALLPTKNSTTQTRIIPKKPAAKYRSQDPVTNHLISTSNTPRTSVGTRGARIVWIAPMIGSMISGIRKNPAGAATNKVARSIVGRWTSGRRLCASNGQLAKMPISPTMSIVGRMGGLILHSRAGHRFSLSDASPRYKINRETPQPVTALVVLACYRRQTRMSVLVGDSPDRWKSLVAFGQG
jgi:hypothetical protein